MHFEFEWTASLDLHDPIANHIDLSGIYEDTRLFSEAYLKKARSIVI
jgi:hypothetical protein